MGRDGERCQTIYFFIYVMTGMGSATPVVVLDPRPHVPIPQLGVCPPAVLTPSCPWLLWSQDGEGSRALTQGLIKFHSLHWVTVLTVQGPN